MNERIKQLADIQVWNANGGSMNLTPETLEQALLSISGAMDEVGKRIAMRPTQLFVSRKMLRRALFLLRNQHVKFMIPFKQRNAMRRAKARMHASFITPRGAA